MPELPEVETVKRGLQKLIVSKQIADVSFDWPKSFPNAKGDVDSFMIGAKIVKVERRAKVLKIHLSTKHSLVIHLKMTGQIVFVPLQAPSSQLPASKQRFAAGHPNDSMVGNLPDRSTRVTITFKDGSKLFFNDQRKFGWMLLLPTIEIENIDFFKKVGPEPLNKQLTNKEFIQRVRRRSKSNIKAVLLDQTVISGIGNIYADEALWVAKIHPETKVDTLSDSKLSNLLKAVREVLQLGIDSGGSTDRNYVNAEGKKGSYMTFAKVFRREGQTCERCGSTIEKIRVAGRGTHVCPKCQRR